MEGGELGDVVISGRLRGREGFPGIDKRPRLFWDGGNGGEQGLFNRSDWLWRSGTLFFVCMLHGSTGMEEWYPDFGLKFTKNLRAMENRDMFLGKMWDSGSVRNEPMTKLKSWESEDVIREPSALLVGYCGLIGEKCRERAC